MCKLWCVFLFPRCISAISKPTPQNEMTRVPYISQIPQIHTMRLFDWLIICWFMSVSIPGEGLQILVLCSPVVHAAFEWTVIFTVPNLLLGSVLVFFSFDRILPNKSIPSRIARWITGKILQALLLYEPLKYNLHTNTYPILCTFRQRDDTVPTLDH